MWLDSLVSSIDRASFIILIVYNVLTILQSAAWSGCKTIMRCKITDLEGCTQMLIIRKTFQTFTL